MGFTLDEIKALSFEELGKADALAQYKEELNKLNDKEKNQLATRLVLECPDDKFGDFFHVIEATRVPQDDTNSFHQVLTNAYEVKKRFTSLLDSRNHHPHTYLLGEEFTEDLYNNFNDLALGVLSGKEVAAAQRLALSTPQEDRSTLARNIRNILPESIFNRELQTAFALRREIDLLLGGAPELFFSSREFNIDNCLKYAGLLTNLLQSHEDQIGKMLASIEDHQQRSVIARTLEQLNHAAHDQSNPFRLIAAAMNPTTEQTHVPLKSEQDSNDEASENVLETDSASESAPAANATWNPNSLFSAGVLTKRSLVKEDPAAAKEDSDDEEEKLEERGRCCGLW